MTALLSDNARVSAAVPTLLGLLFLILQRQGFLFDWLRYFSALPKRSLKAAFRESFVLAGSHLVLDLLGHGHERVLHVQTCLRRGFNEGHLELACELLSFLLGHLALGFLVALVTHQHFTDAGLGVLFNFLNPGSHVLERLPVCDVVHDDYALRSSVVGGGQRAEAFLASGVPNLQFNCLAFVLHTFQFLCR